MINEGDHTNNTSGSTPNFITRLKEYKEFILILVFFVSGFMWIFSYFATKEQVKVLQCLTDQNIILIESRMQKKFLFDELIQKGMEIEKIFKKADVLNEESRKVIQLTNEIEMLKEKLKMTSARYDEAFNFLKMNKCQNP
jgi:lipid A disaccharide synthetase